MSAPEKEDLRKVQLTGGSTYIVSLPKGWVEKVGLGKGSVVSIVQMDDLTLCVQPRTPKRGEEVRRAVIAVTDDITPENITRRVISAYLIGYNIIQIRNPSKRIDLSQRYAVKDFTRKKLIGTEILSDLPRELTLQVLLSHSELSVKDALRRMSIIAASMHRDALSTLAGEDAQLAKEIVSMDDEVDRFGLYIIRLLKAAVVDPHAIREIGLTSSRESLGYRLITKSVERMADHAVNIAQNSLALTMSSLSGELFGELRAVSEGAVGVFEDAIEALFDWDYASAEGVLVRAEGIRRAEAGVVQMIIKNSAPEDVPALRLIVESILRTAEYGADIAEVVLNLTIRDEIREA
ncbi:MAG: phosphate uptake regulator PhoU [Candidatus Bathyarchaeota archaeon]|nr:MAG: phosphate uptake regulator PhoU [Candidatus Bathyarchaeota archaeon]